MEQLTQAEESLARAAEHADWAAGCLDWADQVAATQYFEAPIDQLTQTQLASLSATQHQIEQPPTQALGYGNGNGMVSKPASERGLPTPLGQRSPIMAEQSVPPKQRVVVSAAPAEEEKEETSIESVAETSLENVGHTLRPEEMGWQVRVKGDGWGGKGDGYVGVVIEADDQTYTLVNTENWEEMHVMRLYCSLLRKSDPKSAKCTPQLRKPPEEAVFPPKVEDKAKAKAAATEKKTKMTVSASASASARVAPQTARVVSASSASSASGSRPASASASPSASSPRERQSPRKRPRLTEPLSPEL